jgi:hemolysin activation/secretion protein
MLTRKFSFLRGAFAWLALAGCLCAQETAGPAVTANAPTAENKFLLRQILIGESMEAAQAMSFVPGAGLVVLSPALPSSIDRNELTKRLAAGENRVIDERLLLGITQVVENFFRQQEMLVPAAIVPNQNVADGALRVALLAPVEKKHALRQILIGESVEAVQAMSPAPDAGFVVLSPALPSKIDRNELTKRLAAGENQVINDKLLAAIAQVIENFFRQQDILVPTAVIPPGQNIANGSVRIALLPGKLRNVKIEGNRWFSESLLRQKLRLEQGETLRISELDQAISWTNSNPFRRVRVNAQPVPNTSDVDLTIAVQEARPLRLLASYDNGGNPAIGRNRYTAAVSYANMWGLDHQASYQYITGDLPYVFKAHGFDYRVPLKWRHYLQFSASYSRARPTFNDPVYGLPVFPQDFQTVTSDLRYTIPLRTGDNPAEVYAGLNFKTSKNSIYFLDRTASPVFATYTDIFQFVTGASTIRRDQRGAWAFGASMTVSPGRINSRNTNYAFDKANNDFPFKDPVTGADPARLGAKAAYLYGGINIQRLQKLAAGWELSSRAVLQASEANLLASEELTIGGMSSARGFRDNLISGDNGFVFSNDLMAPAWKLSLPRISKTRGPFEARGLWFFDIAKVGVHRSFNDPKRPALASTGLGLRASLATNFSLSADYGWELTNLPPPYGAGDHRSSRGHLKATLAF